ncbi:MAG: fibrobacter succinogenes major paralogous domain-containing protein [Daejeonella sp.]
MKTNQFTPPPHLLTKSPFYYFLKKPLIFTLLAITLTSVSCKKDKKPSVSTPIPATVDYNGFTYHTVKIGSQVWLMENLRTTKYNDGTTPITLANTNQKWKDAGMEGKEVYGPSNYSANNTETYGLLYNWYAVSKNLAPKGWHIATKDEWEVLRNFLGGEAIAGKAMKEKDFDHWDNFNSGAFNGTNSSGFKALPSGCWLGDEYGPSPIKEEAWFWTATASSNAGAYSYQLYYKDNSLKQDNLIKKYGFSVRCIMDQPAK